MQLLYMIHHEDDVTVRNNSMLVHLVYLGARVILARRILVEKPSRVVKSMRMGGDQEHIDEGIKAACHVKTIVGMLLENKQLFKRCWLAMYVLPRCGEDRADEIPATNHSPPRPFCYTKPPNYSS